jgi:hypothetical protein
MHLGCELGGGLILWSLGLLLDLNPTTRLVLCKYTSLDSSVNLGMNKKIKDHTRLLCSLLYG